VANIPGNPGKQTIYLLSEIEEIQKEAIRQGRSIAWIVQGGAWNLARTEIRSAPSRAPFSRRLTD
jgi:uncharacterized small protein (TIGR04563 family)